MTLWQIDREIEDLLSGAIDEETGEINESVYEALDALQMVKEQKLESIGLYYKNTMALAESIKAEKMNLEKRQKQEERRAESLKRYMQKSLNGEPFKTSKVAVSYRKASSVQINYEDLIPENFLRYKDPEPDKTKIKEALKAGNIVPGAELVENVSMSIK